MLVWNTLRNVRAYTEFPSMYLETDDNTLKTPPSLQGPKGN